MNIVEAFYRLSSTFSHVISSKYLFNRLNYLSRHGAGLCESI